MRVIRTCNVFCFYIEYNIEYRNLILTRAFNILCWLKIEFAVPLMWVVGALASLASH